LRIGNSAHDVAVGQSCSGPVPTPQYSGRLEVTPQRTLTLASLETSGPGRTVPRHHECRSSTRVPVPRAFAYHQAPIVCSPGKGRISNDGINFRGADECSPRPATIILGLSPSSRNNNSAHGGDYLYRPTQKWTFRHRLRRLPSRKYWQTWFSIGPHQGCPRLVRELIRANRTQNIRDPGRSTIGNLHLYRVQVGPVGDAPICWPPYPGNRTPYVVPLAFTFTPLSETRRGGRPSGHPRPTNMRGNDF